MKKLIPFIVLVGYLSCSKESEPKVISTIIGNVYIGKDRTYNQRPLYLIYQFTDDGKISIQERLDSESGELYKENHGYFEYSYPELKLKIQSVPTCETAGCFNYFTASVSEDKKSFTYQVWDITINNFHELVFNVKL